MPLENEKAPDFLLEANNNKKISLSNFNEKWIVLYFYPKDNTPGCTKQACYFRDDFSKYTDKNIIILGISKDNIDSHKQFSEKQNLPFLLLSDENLEVSKLYGVWKEKNNFGKKYMGIERTTFLINPNKIIKKIFKRVKVEGHSELVLKFINLKK